MAAEVENKELEKPARSASNGWQIINFGGFKNPPVWFAAAVYFVAALFAFGVIVLVGFGLYASFEIAYEATVGVFEKRIEAAKVFFPILLALVGGPLLIWRVVTAHVQATAARHQADVAQESLYTSLFTKAVEQLGATREVKTYLKVKGTKKREAVTMTEPNIEVRLGAIYALEKIARNSEQDHWPIMEVLCAYIRNAQNCGTALSAPVGELGSYEIDYDLDMTPLGDWQMSLPAPRIDIQAAVDVIGRRSKANKARERELGLMLDFSEANLQRVKFDRGDFANARFHRSELGSASFESADIGQADFVEANATYAKFDQSKMQFANFEYTHLEYSSFSKADLSYACFDHINAWFADFTYANLIEANLADGIFIAALFDRATMSSATVEYSQFKSARLRFLRLDNAKFSSVKIEYGELREACLVHAKFDDVLLSNTVLSRADLRGLVLFEVDLSDAKSLTTEQLSSALGDASTKLPKGFKRPAAWPDRELAGDERQAWINKVRTTPADKQ